MNILECDKDTHNDRCKYQLNSLLTVIIKRYFKDIVKRRQHRIKLR